MDETPSNLSRNDNPYVHSDGNQRLAGKAFADRTWSWLLGNVILPAGDAAFGQRMLSRLRFLEQAQWWDRERLHAERDRRLSGLMTVAYDQVPYYRQLMDQAGV